MVQFNKNLILKIQRDLKKLDMNQSLYLRTYKGDRGFKITKSNDLFDIIEDGFYDRVTLGISEPDLIKLLEKNLEREFPRSHKIKYQIK